MCNDQPMMRLLSIVLVILLVSTGCDSTQSGGSDPASEAPTEEAEETMPSEYEKAVQAYRAEDYETALSTIQNAIAAHQATPQMFNLQGTIYQQMDEQNSAIESFTQAIENASNYADSYNNRALSRQILGDEVGAEADFRRAIELDPDLGLAYYNLGILLYSRHDYEQAVTHLEKASSLIPADSDLWFQLGLAYDRANRPEDAIRAFSHVIDIEQGFDDQSYYLRGIIHAEQGNIEQAEADFDEAIRKGLKNADTLFYRGLMRYYREAYDLALEDLREAVSYEPYHADAHYYLSFTYARMGDQENARQHAQNALDLDPPVDFGEGGE